MLCDWCIWSKLTASLIILISHGAIMGHGVRATYVPRLKFMALPALSLAHKEITSLHPLENITIYIDEHSECDLCYVYLQCAVVDVAGTMMNRTSAGPLQVIVS